MPHPLRPAGKVSVSCNDSENLTQGSGDHETTNLDSKMGQPSTHTNMSHSIRFVGQYVCICSNPPLCRCDEGGGAKVGGRGAQTQPSVITSVVNGEVGLMSPMLCGTSVSSMLCGTSVSSMLCTTCAQI